MRPPLPSPVMTADEPSPLWKNEFMGSPTGARLQC